MHRRVEAGRAGVLASQIAVSGEEADVGALPETLLGPDNAVIGRLLAWSVLELQILRRRDDGEIRAAEFAIRLGAPIDVAETPAVELAVALIKHLGPFEEEWTPLRQLHLESREIDDFHIGIDESKVRVVGDIGPEIARRPPADIAAELGASALSRFVRGNRVGDDLPDI